MGKYICPNCEARLDPGEKCDCEDATMINYEFSDRNIDRALGEYERPTRWNRGWPYQNEETDDIEGEGEDDE